MSGFTGQKERSMERISVVVPAYNLAPYLGKSLDSLDQMQDGTMNLSRRKQMN